MSILTCFSESAFGQSTQTHFEEGLKLEKAFKVEAALEKYELVLKANPNHAQALHHASRMLSNIGGRMKDDVEKKKNYFIQAKAYAAKSIELNGDSPEARLAHIVAMGLLSEIAASPREKLNDAKVIRYEAETILKIDSTFAGAYFVLGKWHYELAKLSWYEQLACKVFFGGLPEGISIDAAQKYFQKASALEPNTILYLFGEASVYAFKHDYKKARTLLEHALSLPNKEPDDSQRKDRCRQLLNEIKSR